MREIRVLTDGVLQSLDPELDKLYAATGRASVAPKYVLFRSEHLVRQVVECIAGFGCTFPRAKNQADGRVFAVLHPMLASVVQVEVHLACVRVSESAHLEVNDDQTSQTAMEENEVNTEPCIVGSGANKGVRGGYSSVLRMETGDEQTGEHG